jgi:electron transfer flavoprotein alpha subunit
LTTEWRDVWVYLQHKGTSLTPDSLELLAAGRKVADKLQQRLVGVLLGYNVFELARQAIVYGADGVVYVDSQQLATYFNLPYIDAIHGMIAAKRPYAFLFTANEVGKDLAARIAYRVKTGLATDNVQLEVEDFFNPALKQTFKDLLIQIRPDFGTRLARIYTPSTRPQMATVRPGSFAPLQPDTSRTGELEEFKFEAKDYPARVKEVRELPRPRIDLRDANVIISLGLGILKDKTGRARNPKEAYQLAMTLKQAIQDKYGLKTEIGASRALIYAELKELQGLVGAENQVGQTGSTVSPKVYLALGISGALQHRVGMQRSQRIVAVNLDPEAPILQIAHYPIVGDLYEELPRLIKLVGGNGL